MADSSRDSEIGRLVAEPARAAMLAVLLDGRALTAGELAWCAGVTAQTAVRHLARLAGAGMLKVERQGRHRYHRLASTGIAHKLEGMPQLAAARPGVRQPRATGPRDEAMRTARTCYDHFAGRLGIAITDALLARDLIRFEDDAGLVTPAGMAFLADRGIDPAAPSPRGRAFARPPCRPCLDWSERRPHVAGRVGAAICAHFLARDYARRIADSRTVRLTPRGRRALRELFAIDGL